MSLGKVTAAHKPLWTEWYNGDTAWKSVKDILAEKHPPAHAAVTDFLLASE